MAHLSPGISSKSSYMTTSESWASRYKLIIQDSLRSLCLMLYATVPQTGEVGSSRDEGGSRGSRGSRDEGSVEEGSVEEGSVEEGSVEESCSTEDSTAEDGSTAEGGSSDGVFLRFFGRSRVASAFGAASWPSLLRFLPHRSCLVEVVGSVVVVWDGRNSDVSNVLHDRRPPA